MATISLECRETVVAKKKPEPATPDDKGRTITCRVSAATYRRLKRTADRLGVGMSDLFRMLIQENLTPYEDRAEEAWRKEQRHSEEN